MVKDRRRWLHWLYDAKKRYGLIILNYTVTSNHVHLLVQDDGERNVISKSIQLVAGRTGQEYNQRKGREGAYWEDRYHATAIDTEQHLLRCLVYIDLNMIRTGVLKHPSEWEFWGYNEIQSPRRKCSLIAYRNLSTFTGFKTYEDFREAHQELVEEALRNGNNDCRSEWSQSIAVGSKTFVAAIKAKLGVQAKGRKILEQGDVFQLREPLGPYNADFDAKMEGIGPQNACFWGIR